MLNVDGTVICLNKGHVKNGEVKDGTIIQIWESNGTLAQKFYVIDLGLNYCIIH